MPNCLSRSEIRHSRMPMAIACGIAVAASLVLFPPQRAAGADTRPPDILSWRHQSLSEAEYQQLAGEWEAFVKSHPTDVRALVQWGNALRYTGKSPEAREKYKKAFELDSLDVAAVEAYASSIIIQYDDPAGMNLAYDRLLRASQRDPQYAKTYYTLWLGALRAGDEATAAHCLRMMVETGDMPPPLLEYASNVLEGAPHNAIILTNGDNDTYPPLAYQVMTGRRPDVTIANLSLLNTAWYIRYVRGKGVPITFTDAQIDTLKYISQDRLIADQVVEHVAANVLKSGARPLLYSVTIPEYRRQLAMGPCQGLLIPVTGGPVPAAKDGKKDESHEAPCDWARTRELIDTVYRTDGVLDPLVDWKRDNSVAKLSQNYVPLYLGVADWLVSTGDKDAAGLYYLRAIRIYAFQQKKEDARPILDDWAKADPQSKLLPEARRLVEG